MGLTIHAGCQVGAIGYRLKIPHLGGRGRAFVARKIRFDESDTFRITGIFPIYGRPFLKVVGPIKEAGFLLNHPSRFAVVKMGRG